MFSIIIPLYNKAAYIDNSIRSVMNQTYQEFELIIVDDGSTDNPFYNLEFIIHNSQFKEPNLNKKIRIINQENQGVSTARNNGVKVANYDYIAFLDADDWWESTYLEEMKGLIEAFPEAGIYGSSYYKVKYGHNHPANIGVETQFKSGLINYCRVYAKTMYQPLWTGATILKKTIFELEKGFKPQLKLGEDFDLWLRVAMKHPVAFLNKPLAYYNQDVDLANRAIGEKLYEPHEHMLFTDYEDLQKNSDFRVLYEALSVYGLMPYYLANKNKKEVETILSGIQWINHAFKYRLYYHILPKVIVRIWVKVLKFGSEMKKQIIRIVR